MRSPFIAGNWKMHLDRKRVAALCSDLGAMPRPPEEGRVGVFPPFVYLPQVVEALSGTSVLVGAQTARPEAQGAFTGEVSMRQVADVGATHVIVGHSERRHLLGETDVDVRDRLEAALHEGLSVILCVGETLEERRAGRTEAVVLGQLTAGLAGLEGEVVARSITLAYEPVWAIGTGQTATPEQAQEVHALARRKLAELVGAQAAEAAAIQYGGSVKPDNITELMGCPDVDGALVGGASLDSSSFQDIVRRGLAAPRRAGSTS
jgi:triosephosphate isomerase